jgi:hypothetical protein
MMVKEEVLNIVMKQGYCIAGWDFLGKRKCGSRKTPFIGTM